MKFSPNISTLFHDIGPLGERYKHLLLKSQVTFETIECQFPYQLSTNQWSEIFKECKQLGSIQRLPKWNLINSEPLYLHFKWIPNFEDYRRQILDKTLNYAKYLNCQKVHLMLGDVLKDPNYDANYNQLLDLLKKSCQLLQNENITCVIEPLSTRDNYYLQSYSVAQSILSNLNQPNLKIMLDVFHLQRLHGNVTHYINELKEYIGHVQISQVPNRDCPLNEGELDYKYILKILSKTYDQPIGLEYVSKAHDNFDWLINFINL